MLARVRSGAVMGIDAVVVEVEVDLALGMPFFNVVGLPEGAVRESKVRVQSALRNVGLELPPKRVTVNLAPADIRKDGAAFDLPIALGVLAASGQLDPATLERHLFAGELSLDGGVKPVRGVLSLAIAARDAGLAGVVVPRPNGREAAVVGGIEVVPVDNLRELLEHLQGFSAVGPLAPARPRVRRMTADFSEVRGQQNAKRALEVAAAGGHNVLLIGPPGSGKTMLAKRLPGVLPEMTFDESLETTKIYSVTGLLAEADALVVDRPFRAPHHTISDGGLIGGGSIPRPGEVSLAHHGVLFLDELPEFKRSVLEVMRQPLEEGQVTLARAATRLTYPARAMLVAAMNPCPCGHLGDPLQPCRCLPVHVEKYRARVSGPLLDRIDLHVDVPAVRYRELAGQTPEESSDAVRRRVDAARAIQLQRFQGLPGMRCNAQMGVKEVRQFCRVGPDGEKLLARVVDGLGMSARAYDRILKVARTLADLAGQTDISTAQLAEAIQYRSLDRRLATH